MLKMTIKVGDRVRNIYDGFEGIVIAVWDGKYKVPHYDGEQFNPYRITVRFGQDYIEKFGVGLVENGTILLPMEHLEKI